MVLTRLSGGGLRIRHAPPTADPPLVSTETPSPPSSSLPLNDDNSEDGASDL